MSTSREQIMTALLALLQGGLSASFTGDTHATTTIDNLSSPANLRLGLPVFGPGLERNTFITAIGSSSITLSQATKLSGTAVALSSGIQKFGRRLEHWSKVSSFPALFLRDADNDYPERNQNVLPKPDLEPEIWVYSSAGENPNFAPSITLNNLLDAIDAVLKPTTPRDRMTQRLTLGDLVQHCWIQGRVGYDPGDIDYIAKAIIPLKILAPLLGS